MHPLHSRQQAGILDGFETIAHQRLRPNEWPKIPIAGRNGYSKNTAEARLANEQHNQELTTQQRCTVLPNQRPKCAGNSVSSVQI